MQTIEWIAVDMLKPNARNARTHSKKQIRQIADSIATFGFLVPAMAFLDPPYNVRVRDIVGRGRVKLLKC